MAKFLKTVGYGFLSLLLLINLLIIGLVFIPSDKALSFVVEDRNQITYSTDLPDHTKDLFSFLMQEDQNTVFSIPTTNEWSKRAMASLLVAREAKWDTSENHLTFYLNTLDFGDGVFGISQAANYYFNKPPKELTFTETESLANLYLSLHD